MIFFNELFGYFNFLSYLCGVIIKTMTTMNEKIIDCFIEYIEDNHGIMNVKRETIKRKMKIVNKPNGDVYASVEFRGKRYATTITKNNL